MSSLKITVGGKSHDFDTAGGIETLRAEFTKVFGNGVEKIDLIEGDVDFDTIAGLSSASKIEVAEVRGNLTL